MSIKDPRLIDKYYQALLEKNEQYVGIFFVGVKTTSVFCISTCSAKKPLLKNVSFYATFKEALDHGFRPCKICKPTENAHEAPAAVQLAIELVKKNPKEKLRDYQLRLHNISPEVVRRWFKKHHGMTFQAFQRMYRINNALLELKTGKDTTDTAYESGYSSLSGFGYMFKKIIGNSPNHSRQKCIIRISRLTTPLGPMFVCATDNGICLFEFVDRRMLETEFRDVQRFFSATLITGENTHSTQAKREMEEYFDGRRKIFDVKLDIAGTAFQKRVWAALQKIQYGTTHTYQQQAIYINQPTAIRAVASANGFNRVSIIIPCHRVIGKDGAMVGYGGGIERKKWLIRHERNNVE